jgi:3-oxoacyl-[acyl-carrier-protein] synthase II
MKSYVGHTLGACGALESWWAIRMMRKRLVCADHQSHCATSIRLYVRDKELDYIIGARIGADRHRCVMNNNFAFGGHQHIADLS